MRHFGVLLSVVLGILVSGSVLADSSGLPTDFGPISVDASRRELRAKMQDWIDDRSEIKPRRNLVCALSSVADVFLATRSDTLMTLTLLRELPGFLSGRPDPAHPSAPLDAPLALLARLTRLTGEETHQLERLRARQVSDMSDRLRLFVDTETFLMKVSARLYQEQIDGHLSRGSTFLGFFRADAELCAAYSLQVERDTQLLQAASRILAFYDFLEQELAD